MLKNNNKDKNTERPLTAQPSTKAYNDSELFETLKEDGIAVTQQEIQKEREDDAETLYKVSDIHYKNESYEKAFAWFYKAALQEYADSQEQVGWMYRKGQSVLFDFKQAMD